ncbi:MAG TPA: ferredoxin-thioredoxin reductase catalytic domain-containing protein [Methanomicrobiales archaeon]|jgi:ferredoxin-thioredoxin reductase catalytic subunit|nr:ferredoxin-thioredoxin reductase catalytic domain-containing protein [Methanomicrobiales archaeon]
MNGVPEVTDREIAALHERLGREAEEGGYHLNPDAAFVRGLVRGLFVNTKRYGYQSCPCRLASGEKREDLDIICPCDYRDPDLAEYGACYCALYVSDEVLAGRRKVGSIPERRPAPGARGTVIPAAGGGAAAPFSLKYPVYRCRVCGYLCARIEPPDICPVCKAKKDRFERFL